MKYGSMESGMRQKSRRRNSGEDVKIMIELEIELENELENGPKVSFSRSFSRSNSRSTLSSNHISRFPAFSSSVHFTALSLR